MSAEMLWNAILTIAIGIVAWVVKLFQDEQRRQGILLNKTREEVAKEYITKADVHADINRVIARLESMDHKMDRFFERMGSPK